MFWSLVCVTVIVAFVSGMALGWYLSERRLTHWF